MLSALIVFDIIEFKQLIAWLDDNTQGWKFVEHGWTKELLLQTCEYVAKYGQSQSHELWLSFVNREHLMLFKLAWPDVKIVPEY